MKLYYTTSDNGDGSASIQWFDSQEAIDFIEEMDPDTYGMGEGGGWIEISGEVTSTCYGKFRMKTLDDVQKDYE